LGRFSSCPSRAFSQQTGKPWGIDGQRGGKSYGNKHRHFGDEKERAEKGDEHASRSVSGWMREGSARHRQSSSYTAVASNGMKSKDMRERFRKGGGVQEGYWLWRFKETAVRKYLGIFRADA